MAKWEDAYRPSEEPLDSGGPPAPSHDPAIENEPHMRGDEFVADPTENLAGRELDPLGATPSKEDQVEASVWDEPVLAAAAGPGEDDYTYERWLADGERSTTIRKSWWICFGVACLAGPAAVAGTFISQSFRSAPPFVMMSIVGPLVEEIMKAAAILWIVEKRPYLFKTGAQILVCAVASGMMFAAIENVLYLNVYVPNASPALSAWRWSVCVALHVGCTCISAIGLRRVWQKTISQRVKPEMALASTYIMAAVATHALYNTAAIIFSGLTSAF
jgi:hypothetical protein